MYYLHWVGHLWGVYHILCFWNSSNILQNRQGQAFLWHPYPKIWIQQLHSAQQLILAVLMSERINNKTSVLSLNWQANILFPSYFKKKRAITIFPWLSTHSLTRALCLISTHPQRPNRFPPLSLTFLITGIQGKKTCFYCYFI